MSGTAFGLLARPIQHVLWDMRWEALRPIQERAVQALLTTDQDLLITAQTASGKTEAAFLPILSRLFEQPGDSVGAMYVGPLKALIDDQFRRLEELCERAELPVHRWHGDVDIGKKERLLQQPRGVLPITPESLESFFVNRSSSLSHVFGNLRFVVVDEIHSLVGRERGLQLRSQLFRLQRYARDEFRLIGLSATVGEYVAYYQRWIRPSRPTRVVHIDDSNEKKGVLFGIRGFEIAPAMAQDLGENRGADGDEEKLGEIPTSLIADIMQHFGGKKNLIFCNSRQTVEWLADGLNEACRREGRPEEFLVHHGSVSKEVRQYTEEQMRGSRPTTAICSATLELGIDIGSVTTVGQIGPCWSVSSQVQRLGRSGRREGKPHMRVMIPLHRQRADADLVDRLYSELLQAIAITQLMRQRWVEPPTQSAFDLSTLVQQILSVLAEHGGIPAKPLYDRLVRGGAFQQIEPQLFADVLRSLGSRELIEQMSDGVLLLAPQGEKLVHDMEFYSAFASAQELVVRYQGRTIGSLSAMYVPQPGDHFLLGGRRWQTVEVDARNAEILVKPATGKKPPRFLGSGGEIHPRIRETMQDVLRRDDEYSYLNDTAAEFLLAARTSYRNAVPGDVPVVVLGERACLWFTWTGTRVQRTLMLLADHVGLSAADRRIAIRFEATPQQVAERLDEIRIGNVSEDELTRDLTISGWRKFDGYLNDELLRKPFCTDWLDVDGARRKVRELVA